MTHFDFIITSTQQSAMQSMERLLRTFSFVPDEMLNYSPTPTSKSALRIAAHQTLIVSNLTTIIGQGKAPTDEEVRANQASREDEEIALTDRNEIERINRKNTGLFNSCLDQLSPDDLEVMLASDAGWNMSMLECLAIPGMDAQRHAGQIEYLQTCWHDQEMHF